MNLPTRILRRIDRSGGPHTCWPWLGSLRNGYAATSLGRGRMVYVHRLVAALTRDVEGMEVHHVCENRNCLNPDHLRVLTASEHYKITEFRKIAQQAAYAARTHCRHGHPYSEANTYRDRDGYRECRICRLEASRRHRACQSPVSRVAYPGGGKA
jgi:hypothetical protein